MIKPEAIYSVVNEFPPIFFILGVNGPAPGQGKAAEELRQR